MIKGALYFCVTAEPRRFEQGCAKLNSKVDKNWPTQTSLYSTFVFNRTKLNLLLRMLKYCLNVRMLKYALMSPNALSIFGLTKCQSVTVLHCTWSLSAKVLYCTSQSMPKPAQIYSNVIIFCSNMFKHANTLLHGNQSWPSPSPSPNNSCTGAGFSYR